MVTPRRLLSLLLAASLCVSVARADVYGPPPGTSVPVAGVTDGSNAASGKIGEFLSAQNSDAATATITVTIASPGVVSWTAHGLSCASAVYFTTTGALPTGITAATTLYVTCGASLLTNSFQVSTTVANAIAGTSVNTSGTQSGVHTGFGRARLVVATKTDLVGLSLTAGDWDCRGYVSFRPAGTTTIAEIDATLNTTSVAFPAIDASASGPVFITGTLTTGGSQAVSLAPTRVNVSSTTTIFVIGQSNFGTSTMDAGGRVECRRIR